jgi:hypothetical protein
MPDTPHPMAHMAICDRPQAVPDAAAIDAAKAENAWERLCRLADELPFGIGYQIKLAASDYAGYRETHAIHVMRRKYGALAALREAGEGGRG